MQYKYGCNIFFQAVYVRADDFTDPAVVHTFGHLTASIVLFMINSLILINLKYALRLHASK